MTIREIAEQCGVSSATVDRVLNGRGKVRPQTEALVLSALEKSGYAKNIAARALAIRKVSPVVGVIISSKGNPFFDEVLEGVAKAETELARYGIKVKLSLMRGYNPERQLALIQELESSLSVLVLHPIDDSSIVKKVNDLAEQGIPTVTVNTDLRDSRRCCYVGSDYEKGGETAAGIMRLAIREKTRLGILTGVDTLLGHRQRLLGLERYLASRCPHIDIIARMSAQDDDESAYAATCAMLREHPDIDTLALIAAGLAGVWDALVDLKREQTLQLFAFDSIPVTRRVMAGGPLKAVVCQQPFEQGYLAVKAAMDIILSGSPSSERIIMENQIRILENL